MAAKKTPAKKTGSNSQPPKPKKPGTGVSQTKSTRQRTARSWANERGEVVRSTYVRGDVVSSSVDPKNVPVFSGADIAASAGRRTGRTGERAYVSAVKKGKYGPVKKVPKGAAITGVVAGYGSPYGDTSTEFRYSKEYAKGAKKGSMTGKAKKKK